MGLFRFLAHKVFWDVFLTERFFLAMGGCAVLFVVSFFYPPFLLLPKILFWAFILLVVVDYFFLFASAGIPAAKRIMTDRLSNGDENIIEIQVKNNYSFEVASPSA